MTDDEVEEMLAQSRTYAEDLKRELAASHGAAREDMRTEIRALQEGLASLTAGLTHSTKPTQMQRLRSNLSSGYSKPSRGRLLSR